MPIPSITRCTFRASSAGMTHYNGPCVVLYRLGDDWYGPATECYVIRAWNGGTIDAFAEELTVDRDQG